MNTMTYFDISGRIVLIKSEIFIAKGIVWLVSSDKMESALREEALAGDCKQSVTCIYFLVFSFVFQVPMSPNEPLLSTQSTIE